MTDAHFFRRRFFSRVLPFLLLVAAGILYGTRTPSRPAAPLTVDRAARTVELSATVDAAGFERKLLGMPGYHLIVAEGGRSASAALFRTQATDTQVLDALESLGGRPGGDLPMATWEERKDPGSKAPDEVAAGPSVEVLVRVPGRPKPLTLGEILEDSKGQGVDLRLAGNRANIPRWKSGCIACLYSCPGGKLANAKATVREWQQDPTRYRVRPGVLPADGTRVVLVLHLAAPRAETPR
jgi:hypothetical protein